MSPPPLAKRYLDPKIDLAFKRVFGVHANLLKSLLNALLPLPADGQIDTLEYLTPEQAPEIPGLCKHSIVDVKCTDQKGRIFIVEMQMMWSASFEQRMVFGASQAYVKQLRAGQTRRELKPVYALAIINGTLPAASGIAADAYYRHYRIVNVLEPKQMLAGLEFVLIELPKFRPEGRGEKRLQTLWLRFLREVGAAPSQVIDAELLQDHDIAQAIGLVEQGAFTEAELAGFFTRSRKAKSACFSSSSAACFLDLRVRPLRAFMIQISLHVRQAMNVVLHFCHVTALTLARRRRWPCMTGNPRTQCPSPSLWPVVATSTWSACRTGC